MKSRQLSLFCGLFVCVLFSCKKNGSTPITLIGNWTLQQEHVVFSIDGVVTMDTVFNASALTHGNVQFNKDNTYSSASVNIPSILRLDINGGSTANAIGTYSYSNNVFTIKPGIAGWFNYAEGSSTVPVLLLNTIGITRLTPTNLNFHTDGKYSYTLGNGSHIDETVSDFYYTK